MQLQGKAKKVLEVLLRVITIIVVIFTVGMMMFTIFSVNTFDKNDRSLFGIKFFIVQTDSMSPSENNEGDKITFSSGDVVIIKELEPAEKKELVAGDVISFISQNSVNCWAESKYLLLSY